MLGLLGFLVLGLVAGAIARLLVPGKDSMGLLATMLLGIVGSFVGGTLASLVFGGAGRVFDIRTSGLIGSVLGAVVVLLVFNAVTDRKRVTS
ncbi:GlsB/YeaQ/YmgE family stress response membrane protein [Nocardioides sp. CFH 31398]|uniref:GlsB/YeaQ/YmgE family stress response membrane protein n=1 Tax=Nocardioides sp. CFH 31398 TaxID=2919579 RepID=UPI001F053049|nr:GlsB/YeaQ/YmgE family stress response membrane protein [Nocardioides sp. CFH 31398]MCH1868062.1 GlsB/YeaQ/YmgE family stress response membrane protein [Nocardioides sp. CFH 31398]